MTSELDAVVGWSGWSPLDRQLANMLLREVGSNSVPLWLSVALLTWVARQGDVCIDLAQWANQPLAAVLSKASRDLETTIGADLRLPNLVDWQQLLDDSGLVGRASSEHPLTLKGSRLYLARYHQHEAALAARVVERLVAVKQLVSADELRRLVEHWFSRTGGQSKQAAVIAVTRRLCLITGGPGTGKTSTVVRLLGLLTELGQLLNGRPPRVLLLAPTGKAAARLTESIVQAKQRLVDLSASIAELPTKASTVHGAVASCRRLPDGSRIPLRADVVILDEASMVDLVMMDRLLGVAVNVERLVVLGDPYQLASVEAGAVLGEFCATSRGGYVPEIASIIEECSGVATQARPAGRAELEDHRVELIDSHRFRGDGGIGLLAQCIKNGDPSGAFAILGSRDKEVGFLELPQNHLEQLEEMLVRGNEPLWLADSPAAAIGRLQRFRVLCAHRKGRFGVETWNERLSRRAKQVQSRERQRIQIEPILITENAPDAVLHNGDLGVVWREPDRLRAWFALVEGKAAEMGLSQLPKYETAYAMSVHKSQGSEVDEVFVLLPDAGSALLTRELLYTAVTRARKRCTLVGTRAAIEQAVTRRVERHSGLGSAIAELVAHGRGQEA